MRSQVRRFTRIRRGPEVRGAWPRSSLALARCLAPQCAGAADAQLPLEGHGPARRKPARGSIYLVGSVHLLTKDYYPLSPALDAAFKDSDLLVEEADLGEMLSPAVADADAGARACCRPTRSLDTVVSPADASRSSPSASPALGLPIEPLKRFKPWMLALTLVELEWQKAGFDAELGLDKHFYDRAQSRRQGASRDWRRWSSRFRCFDEMPLDEQEQHARRDR